MNILVGLEQPLSWLLTHSLQASVLVVLVLLVQWLFRRQLTNRWRFALWWVVLARLLLPFSPQSAVSLFNVFQPTLRLEGTHYSTPVQATPSTKNNLVQVAQPSTSLASSLSQQTGPADSVSMLPNTPIPKQVLRFKDFLTPGLAALWLAGMLGLSGMVIVQVIRFYWKLARASMPADPQLRVLLDDCRREFGLSRPIELMETDAVQSPALFGLLRLRLLLPRGIGTQFAERELRYIFLHEIAHVKRGDLWLNWLVTALQIMHWFNPLLWLGFARLRADRELACDELALLCAGDKAGTAYGETVVKLLENLSRPAAIPGLVGILEDGKQMRRRISMIANFRKPGRWSMLAAVLIAALAAAALTDAQTSKPSSDPLTPNATAANSTTASVAAQNRLAELIDTNSGVQPDLTGQVLAKGGVSLSVPATVFIATAAPKSGTSSFCPSCYLDCAKHARTDLQGVFKIESLSPQLTFQVLAVAKGYQPKYISKVDPAKGKPLTVELEPIAASDAAPERSLRGRVVDPKGEPVEGAVVEMQGINTKDGGGSWGALPGIDPLAVTDENGEFLITAKKAFEMMSVKVTARSYADKAFTQLVSGGTGHKLVMTEGATLTGRVLLSGQPLVGVSVGVSAVDRSAGSYLGHFEVGTGDRGTFTFVNLPPDADFHLYSLMETMAKFGAVPPRQIHTGKDGETTDAKDLVVGPAYRLAGRLVLADGQPVPDKTRLLISREAAWDSMQLTLGPDGKFDVAGVPAETTSLSVRVNGYHVSARNLSVDQMNPFQLIGRVDQDITNLVFLLEKGPDPQPDYSHVNPDYVQVRQRSLRGAEGVPDHSREWTVSGRVLDSATKQPVENFRVTPGQSDEFNRTAWSTLNAVEGSNGLYLTYLSKRAAQPLLKVEADGYLPESLTVLPHDATNVDFVLKKGTGPVGSVVTPDGKPAAGATVVLLTDDYNQAGFNSASELTTYWNKSVLRQADSEGKFSFKPVWEIKTVAAASSNGFAVLNLETFVSQSKIILEPFGNVTGTLKRSSGPATNESLGLMFAGVSAPRINLSQQATTDTNGRFTFERVPAGHLQVYARKPVVGNQQTWTSEVLQEIYLKPGQTLKTNLTATDKAAIEVVNTYKPPQLKSIPDVEVKGIVLSPSGKPGADADVALQVDGKYLALGKGAFASSGLREEGLIVNARPDGSFSLPMYEGAKSVIALNEEGYAQVSLEQLRAFPQIRLQKWGRIDGTLRVGHRVGTNERVVLSAPQPRWSNMSIRNAGQPPNQVAITNSSPIMLQPPIYDFNAFQAKTDDQGRFVITFVPPGQHTIARLLSTGEGSWSHSQLAYVEVKPGETTVTNVGGIGRTVTGKVKFSESPAPDMKNGVITIRTPTIKLMQKVRELKTDEERKAIYQSEEFQAATKGHRSFSAAVLPDGSFRVEEVLPGKYEVNFQARLPTIQSGSITIFASLQELLLPEAKDKDDDSSVDWGEVELKKYSIPIPNPTNGGK